MDLMNLFIDNFWLLFLIIVFLFKEGFFLCGVCLLAVPCILGYEPKWAVVVIVAVGICTYFLDPYNFWKKKYTKKARQLEEKYGAQLDWYEQELTKAEKKIKQLEGK